jgi:hypothetical protein
MTRIFAAESTTDDVLAGIGLAGKDPDYARLRLSCQIEVTEALEGLTVTVAEN